MEVYILLGFKETGVYMGLGSSDSDTVL